MGYLTTCRKSEWNVTFQFQLMLKEAHLQLQYLVYPYGHMLDKNWKESLSFSLLVTQLLPEHSHFRLCEITWRNVSSSFSEQTKHSCSYKHWVNDACAQSFIKFMPLSYYYLITQIWPSQSVCFCPGAHISHITFERSMYEDGMTWCGSIINNVFNRTIFSVSPCLWTHKYLLVVIKITMYTT